MSIGESTDNFNDLFYHILYSRLKSHTIKDYLRELKDQITGLLPMLTEKQEEELLLVGLDSLYYTCLRTPAIKLLYLSV